MAIIVLVSLCAVCVSSTSASAAAGSSTNAQPSAALVSAPIVGGPAVCSLNGNEQDLFVQGADHALWWKHWQAGMDWTAWKSLGGILTSDPAAAIPRAGVIYVFARGTDGALWSTLTSNGGGYWNPWVKVGGQLLAGTGPAAYSWGSDRTGWFVTGTNHQLYHMWIDDTGRHGWENLGGYLTSSPAARGGTVTKTISVFARGRDGALWGRYGPNAWTGWSSLGFHIAPGTGPAVDATWQYSTVYVCVQGTNGALYRSELYSGTQTWEYLGGHLTSSPAIAASTYYVRGTDGNIWGYQHHWYGPISGPP